MIDRFLLSFVLFYVWGMGLLSSQTNEPQPPNVLFILTDDQGIGDLGCHGNPWIKTPNLDRFYQGAVRFTDYHVSPLCTPTRAALMTRSISNQ